MKNFISKISSILAVSDLVLVFAQDGNNVSIQVLPKAKVEGAPNDFPSLNFSGDISEFNDEFGDMLAAKLQKSMPLVSNINAFEKTLADLEKSKKEKLEQSSKAAAKKPAPAKKEDKKEEAVDTEEEKQETTETETATETTTSEPQKTLF